MVYSTLAMSDNFDIIIDDSGYMRIDTDSMAIVDRIRLDLSCNSDWILDETLGVGWLTENNKGLLQYKQSELAIITAIEKKLMTINGVKEINSITLSPIGNRGIKININVKTILNDNIDITSEVRNGFNEKRV